MRTPTPLPRRVMMNPRSCPALERSHPREDGGAKSPREGELGTRMPHGGEDTHYTAGSPWKVLYGGDGVTAAASRDCPLQIVRLTARAARSKT